MDEREPGTRTDPAGGPGSGPEGGQPEGGGGEAPAPGTPAKELRIAAVMTGGVSLCVWMGGVTLELDELRRKQRVYGRLLQVTGLEPVIDIVGGTSAGGLNGTLLASAMAWGSDLSGLSSVWFGLADFDSLLEPVTESDPQSLLQGDAVFLEGISRVLGELHETGGRVGAGAGHSALPLHLIVTTTTMKPWEVTYADSQGFSFSDMSYQGLFRFVREGERDDFATVDSARALALAARSSASFPGAFEPVLISVNEVSSGVDMAPFVNFTESRYVMDGGVVDNDPLDAVLDAIANQPADGPVRRMIVSVDPLGGKASSPPPAQAGHAPSLLRVLEGALLIPRLHSNATLYERLTDREHQGDAIQDFRADLFEGMGEQRDPIDSTSVEQARTLLDAATRLRPAVQRQRAALRLEQGDTSDRTVHTSRQSLLIVQDLLRRSLDDPTGLPDDVIETIRVNRAAVSAALTTAAPAQDELLDSAMTALLDTVGVLDHLVAGSGVTERARRLRREILGIEAMADAASPVRPAWATALDALGVLQGAVTDGDVHNPQQIGLVEISGANAYTSDLPPTQKLAGVQAAHFGAFYASSWRHNDWIWGRLDGSFRLIAMLVDPELLLETHDPHAAASALAGALEEDPGAEFWRQVAVKLEAVRTATVQNERKELSLALQDELTTVIWSKERDEILAKELPGLLDSARADRKSRIIVKPAAPAFLTPPPGASQAEVWGLCSIGSERIDEQIGSRYLQVLALQTAAVGVEVVRRGGVPRLVRWALIPLHWLLRTARFAVSRLRRT